MDKNTLSVIHRVMKERKCKKSAAVDHIVGEYERRKRKGQVDEVAERVIEKFTQEMSCNGELFVKMKKNTF